MSTTYSITTNSKKHFSELDGLRGIAILMVIIYHYFLMHRTGIGQNFPIIIQEIFLSGWIGVDLFFVLSGFLITGILLDSKNSDNYFKNFFMRRVLRIFPLYYGFLFILIIFVPIILGYSNKEIVSLQSNQWWYWTYLTNYLIVIKNGYQNVPLGYFWSLAVEEQFYLIWPFVILYMSYRKLLVTALFLVVISILVKIVMIANGYNGSAIQVNTFGHLEPLMMGAILAISVRRYGVSEIAMNRFKIASAISFLILLFVSIYFGEFTVQRRFFSLFALLLLSIIFGYILLRSITNSEQSRLSRILRTNILRKTGKYSYAMYVLHPLVGRATYEALDGIVPFNDSGYWLIKYLIFFTIALIVTYFFSILSWNLYEKHFLALKKHFT